MTLAAWSTVRGVGNIKYFNISYGVILGVPILHELYAKAVPFMKWFGAPGPFPETLRWLYAASVCYALAIGVYQVFGPSEIKRFGKNDDEYLRTQYETYMRALPNHQLNVILAHLDANLDRATHDRICELLEMRKSEQEKERLMAQSQLDELVLALRPDAVQRYLLKDYEAKDRSRAIARWASFLLYIAGTVIVLILLIARNYEVLLAA